MENTIIRKFKWFWGWADEKEEAWLGEMARQGWHLRELVFPTVYEFEQGEPKEVAYRLDYNAIGRKERENYLQLFADAGWEHVGEVSGWHYFRKEVQPGETLEIFTDNESKIEKYKRLLAFLVVLLPVYILTVKNVFEYEGSGLWLVIQIISLSILILLTVAVIKIIQRVRNLRK